MGLERRGGDKIEIFEKLSLFDFKNCKTAHFLGKFLVKLLVKWPLKHLDKFRRVASTREAIAKFSV